MIISHKELQLLYNSLFSNEIKRSIGKFLAQDIENPEYYYSTQMLWDVDSLIGGIGGYCMPADPVKNPFPVGIQRELYRPLQYARSNIDICSVVIFARHVVQDAGIHLEAVCRLFLKTKCTFGNMRFNDTTLGKAIQKIKQQEIFEKEFIDLLNNFVVVYNRAKHEINQDETKDRMFNAYDALVAYFAVRILGLTILKEIGREESFQFFKVYR